MGCGGTIPCMNREPFAANEWYHCYTPGVDKRKAFQHQDDYQRFLQRNSNTAIHRSDLKPTNVDVFSQPRGKQRVLIAAFCLMPNHFHLVMSEATEGGIPKVMQKVGT